MSYRSLKLTINKMMCLQKFPTSWVHHSELQYYCTQHQWNKGQKLASQFLKMSHFIVYCLLHISLKMYCKFAWPKWIFNVEIDRKMANGWLIVIGEDMPEWYIANEHSDLTEYKHPNKTFNEWISCHLFFTNQIKKITTMVSGSWHYWFCLINTV